MTYLDINLIFITATLFMNILKESGGVAFSVRGILVRFHRSRTLLVILLTVLLLLPGALTGEGPWRIGDAVIRVLGCQNTDPHLQGQYLPWKAYLEQHGDRYPPPQQVREIARRLGALPSDGQ